VYPEVAVEAPAPRSMNTVENPSTKQRLKPIVPLMGARSAVLSTILPAT
jgi:hypothetical protein